VKLIIQTPCFNEATTLPATIQALPKQLPGIDLIELLVIDDGSTDGTPEIAQKLGVDHIIRLPRHSGLAVAFVSGLEACLKNGADLIINTDADNQYQAEDIINLIQPILDGKADLVIGDRGIDTQQDFSASKKVLQKIGSWVTTQASGIKTPDATSGFRAISREAAMRTLVLNQFSFTLETLIQAGTKRMAVVYVPVRTNPKTRPSRLMKNTPHYLLQSGTTILRAYTMYRPLRVFTIISSLLILGGVILGLRYLYFYLSGQGGGHIQSVVLAAVLLIIGFQTLLIGLVADLIGFNRIILEEMIYRLRKIELDENDPSPKNR